MRSTDSGSVEMLARLGLAREQSAAAGGAQGQRGAAEQRAGAVVAVAVPVVQAVQDPEDGAGAPLACPGQRAERVVDAEAHRRVDVGFARDAGGEGVGGEVRQHGDRAGDDQAGHVVDHEHVQARRLEQADGLGEGGGRAAVGGRDRDGRGRGRVEHPVDDDHRALEGRGQRGGRGTRTLDEERAARQLQQPIGQACRGVVAVPGDDGDADTAAEQLAQLRLAVIS